MLKGIFPIRLCLLLRVQNLKVTEYTSMFFPPFLQKVANFMMSYLLSRQRKTVIIRSTLQGKNLLLWDLWDQIGANSVFKNCPFLRRTQNR